MGNRLVRCRLKRSKTLKLKLGFFTQYVLHRPQRVVRSARRFAPVNIFFRKDTLKMDFFQFFLVSQNNTIMDLYIKNLQIFYHFRTLANSGLE